MEKLTLIPQHHEIIVNNGSMDGTVDLFSYAPEMNSDMRARGGLYVVGHRNDDATNVGYMVSLIAALARREYYAQPELSSREAFLRTLKKVNEVVDEFFKSNGTDLSVGIFAIAGTSVLVSKLDKFRILLARQDEVVDILNNVILFKKEHIEKKRFSSIVSGTVQPGDRLLAYYPSKAVVSRERYLKSYFLKLPYKELVEKISGIGKKQPTFATALLYVDMVHDTAHIASPAPKHDEVESIPALPPDETTDPLQVPITDPRPSLAWSPRQYAPTPQVSATVEPPRIISSEFALGTRRNMTSRWLGKLRVIRLDTRGKMVFLAIALTIIVGSSFGAKSLLLKNPEEQKLTRALDEIKSNVATAKEQIGRHEAGSARQLLMRALSALSSYSAEHATVQAMSADILKTMDALDNAQDANLSLVAQANQETDMLGFASWSSSSQSTWVITGAPDHSLAVAQVRGDDLTERVNISDTVPSMLIPFKSGVLVLDMAGKKIIRIIGTIAKSYIIPTQETVLNASVYQNNLYVLTDHSILKISDLDTNTPVTKQWLATPEDLAVEAMRISVDGNIYTLGKDGVLTTYYKNKKISQVQTPMAPSGSWELIAGPEDTQLSIANLDTKRIYIMDISTGNLLKTLKLNSQQPLVSMSAGPDGSILVISKDNKIWKVQ